MSSFADVLRPSQKSNALVFDILTVFGGSLLLALSAQIALPLFFTPVPMTMQLLVVLMLGALLGSKKGALAVLCYLLEGACGMPVFAFAGGFAKLYGPTAGYLYGFVGAAFLIGYLLEHGSKVKFFYTFIAMMLGTLLVLGCGALWLSLFVGGFGNAIKTGVLPFIAGDCLKILVAASAVRSGWKLLGR